MEILAAGSSAYPPRILVFTTDGGLRDMIVSCVADSGMEAGVVSTRDGLVRTVRAGEPDAVVLDQQLDGDDGLEVLKELRARSFVPVVLLTKGEDEGGGLSMALDLGADYCLVKPFTHRDLLARLRASLRRRRMDALHPPRRRSHAIRFDGWVLDPRTRTLTDPSGEPVALTNGEFALLSALLRSPGRPLSRERLLQATRVHEDVLDRSVEVQILRLRRKIAGGPSRRNPIRTVRGRGYAFVADVDV